MTAPVPLLLLLGVGAALAATLAWEWQPVEPTSGPLPQAAAGPRREAPQPAPGPGPIAAWAAASLARPLFDPARRPPAPGAQAGIADTELPRLAGILVTAEGRSAIFAGTPRPLVVREGAEIGGFMVQAIVPGQVTLFGPDGIRVLRTAFDPARPGAPATPPPPPPVPVQALHPASGGDGPPIPGTSPPAADAPQDAMPFAQNPAPTGLDILNRAGRTPPAAQ